MRAAPAAEVRNEFAAVLVSLDHGANAPRLRVQDLESGAVALLDAFVLRSLCLLASRVLTDVCRATVPGDPEAPAAGPPPA